MRVIQLARKPLQGTLVSNLTKYHTGALCIHGTRIGSEVRINQPAGNKGGQSSYNMGVYGMPQAWRKIFCVALFASLRQFSTNQVQ